MTWLRFGCEFTRDRRWEGVSYEARWHYHALLADCADSERYDCRLPMRLALRASDVPDPDACIQELVATGWAAITADTGDLLLTDGEQKHMPPPSLRDNRRKAQQRKWTANYRARKGEGKASPVEVEGSEETPGDHDSETITGESRESVPRAKPSGEPSPQNRTEQNRAAPTEGPNNRASADPAMCPDCHKPRGSLAWCCTCEAVA